MARRTPGACTFPVKNHTHEHSSGRTDCLFHYLMTLHHLRSLHSVWPVLGALGDCELMLASDCSTYLGRRKNIHIRLKTVRDRQGASSSVSRGISESTLINTTSRSRLPIVVGNLYHEQTARCCGLVP